MSQLDHFERVAARYDELRSPPGLTILQDTLVTEGDLAGKRVLDIGCGTGAALAVLARASRAGRPSKRSSTSRGSAP
jgi:ubiquinone/menaquinone biosynthesis C-methylase UbiE